MFPQIGRGMYATVLGVSTIRSNLKLGVCNAKKCTKVLREQLF